MFLYVETIIHFWFKLFQIINAALNNEIIQKGYTTGSRKICQRNKLKLKSCKWVAKQLINPKEND